MRNLYELEKYRVKTPDILRRFGSFGDDTCGVFVVTAKTNGKKCKLQIIASCGEGWEHVSVSLFDRSPTWSEMDKIKRLFFKPDELAIQYHVPVNDHINIHPNCLHLWRPVGALIPLPPKWMV